MRREWCGESLLTDLLGALTAMGYNFIRSVAVVKKPDRAKLATLGDAIVGAGGLIAKSYVGSPIAHEMLEALGFTGFANLGAWAAAVAEKANNIPVWRPGGKSESAKMVETVPLYVPPTPVRVEPAPTRVEPAPAVAAAPSSSSYESEEGYEFEY